MDVSVERVTDVVVDHGEGPCWHEASGRLLWVDMFEGSVLATDPSSGESELTLVKGPVAAFVRPIAGRDAVAVACEKDVQELTADGPVSLVSLPLEDGLRCNEGACDPQGRMYVGTLAHDVTPGRGAMYRIDADGSVEVVLNGLTVSNGLAWSPDGATAYFVDTAKRCIDRFSFDPVEGRLEPEEALASIEEDDAHPDGICVDAEGGVWVALWGTGTVRRYEPSGAVSATVDTGCAPVTACAFGGPDLRTLFVTTSRYLDNPAPKAGSLFACSPGVAGAPVHAFVAPVGAR